MLKIMTDEEFRALFAHRIKSLRLAKSWTQDDIEAESRRLGFEIKQTRYGNWEKAHRGIGREAIEVLAKLFGTTAAYLRGETDVVSKESEEWRYMIPRGESVEDRAISMDFFAMHVDQLRAKGFNERDILAIKVHDHTVAPFVPGDAVFIDASRHSITKPVLCAIRVNAQLVWLRYIKPEMHGSFTMYCSDKEHYPDQTLTPEQLGDLDIIGQYIGHFHWQN